MTLEDRRRTHPVAAGRSQRELVAWSLLIRPHDRPPKGSR
jgi:hypothetical protein